MNATVNQRSRKGHKVSLVWFLLFWGGAEVFFGGPKVAEAKLGLWFRNGLIVKQLLFRVIVDQVMFRVYGVGGCRGECAVVPRRARIQGS